MTNIYSLATPTPLSSRPLPSSPPPPPPLPLPNPNPNPLRRLLHPARRPPPPANPLLSTPPLLPLPEPPPEELTDGDDVSSSADAEPVRDESLRQKGQIFVANLPPWVKKSDVADFFRQFGPLKDVILIRAHDTPERNTGYCFVGFGGPTADDAAAAAVELDGAEFHGRTLTVRLDDGRRTGGGGLPGRRMRRRGTGPSGTRRGRGLARTSRGSFNRRAIIGKRWCLLSKISRSCYSINVSAFSRRIWINGAVLWMARG